MPHVWSVTELTNALKRTLEATFPVVDLEGEVSGFKRYPSGHIYWTIKDENSQISAVMFKSLYDACSGASAIKDGARIKVRGRVTAGLRSQYQLVVMKARAVGDGELMQRFLELKAKLTAEGLFDQANKRQLPFLPRRIGIITSEAGSVVHDMCRVLMRRFKNLEIRIFPSLVQGPMAPQSLIAGFNYFNNCKDWQADVILFGRGGGDFSDLFCFNDEALVRTIAESKIPTISAVGHETDVTLSDFAADLRAGTPSMAAELAVKELSTLLQNLSKADNTLTSSFRGAYEYTAQKVDALANDLAGALWRHEKDAQSLLDRLSSRLTLASANMLSSCDLFLHRINCAEEKSSNALNLYCLKTQSSLKELETKLNLLSPYSVLDRGYSLTTNESGEIIRDANTLKEGDKINTRLQIGTLTSLVISG